jgi:hypothetical protein
MLAMVVNANAGILAPRGVLAIIGSLLAPAGDLRKQKRPESAGHFLEANIGLS